MDTRRCADCDEDKTVRGVWFLVGRSEASAESLSNDSRFLCEECYSDRTGGLRGSNLQRDPSGRSGASPS